MSDLWIKLASGAAQNLLCGLLVASRLAVDSFVGHRVKRVYDRENARENRNLFLLQPTRIALAVPALMVRKDVFRNRRKIDVVLRDAETNLRMLAHLEPFRFRQRAGFLQDRIIDSDFADVVQHREQRHLVLHLVGDAEDLA